MRHVFSLVGFLILTPWLCADPLDYSGAPQEALGYAFGTAEESVVSSLDLDQAVMTREPARTAAGFSRITIPRQKLDKLGEVTYELSFVRGSLYQVSVSMAPSPEVLRSLTTVLGVKYGKVQSSDGGYHYNWFFYRKLPPAAVQGPDFAIVLAYDPVTRNSLRLTYADNYRKAGSPASAGGPPVTEDGVSAPVLDPSRF